MTLRELLPMTEARSRAQWTHTSALLALLANCHRDPKRRRPYVPADFLPQPAASASPAALPQADVSLLKTLFIDRHLPETSR